MNIGKFVERVSHGNRAPDYVLRIDRTPIQMTTNRELALIMGNSRLKTPPNRSKILNATPSYRRYR